MKKSKSSKLSSENGAANQTVAENFLIVGIGASAGGIQALKDFFEKVPADSGAAYVVILHLSPDHEKFRIYQSRQAAAKSAYSVPDAPSAIRYAEPKMLPPSVAAGTAGTSPEQENRLLERISFGDLHRQLLEQYAPPSIVVNENYDIVHLSERAGRFLQISGGEPSKNLLRLVRPELRLELRAALFQAAKRGANVVAANLKVQTNGYAETINIQIRPVLGAEDTARGFLLVLFESSQAEDAETATEKIIASDELLAHRLEAETRRWDFAFLS